ncbi:hypothetical protein [Lapidilactobacillus wuchangensis]|uniref:hypothetical protein n=1 Tax=Lapidilactobacillus wuchangensis TaxID=2486001 RepID=UPI000F767B8E|nr:hypothetical protein [Lapidilactobacillus wuchangensis]
MAELSPIFNGMENGPTAIDTNFKNINTVLATLSATSSMQEIKGVNGAAKSAWLTVDKVSHICVLVIWSKLPKKTTTMYWIPAEYAAHADRIPVIKCGDQATLSINGNGNVQLLGNTSDSADAIGFAVWGY